MIAKATAKAIVLAVALLALAGLTIASPAFALNGDGESSAATPAPSGVAPPAGAPASPQASTSTPVPGATATCRKAHAPVSAEEQARRKAIRAQRAAAKAAEGGGSDRAEAGMPGSGGTTVRTVHRARPHLPPC